MCWSCTAGILPGVYTLTPYFLEITYFLTYSIQQSHSWENNRFSASQKIPPISWNPKVHYRIHKCPPPLLIFSQLNPVHTLTSLLPKIHLNIILPSTPVSPQWYLSLRFPYRIPINASPFPIRATCPAHFILLYFITRRILGEEDRTLSSSLCSFLHSPFTSSLLGPIFSSAPYSQTPSTYVPPSMSATKFHTHTKQQAKLYFCI